MRKYITILLIFLFGCNAQKKIIVFSGTGNDPSGESQKVTFRPLKENFIFINSDTQKVFKPLEGYEDLMWGFYRGDSTNIKWEAIDTNAVNTDCDELIDNSEIIEADSLIMENCACGTGSIPQQSSGSIKYTGKAWYNPVQR